MANLLHAPTSCLADISLMTICLCFGGKKASVKGSEGTFKIMQFDCVVRFDGSVPSVCHIMDILPVL